MENDNSKLIAQLKAGLAENERKATDIGRMIKANQVSPLEFRRFQSQLRDLGQENIRIRGYLSELENYNDNDPNKPA